MTGSSDRPGPPAKLRADHDLSQFDSGVLELDEWLRQRAWANAEAGASRTYVVSAGGRIVGYYALSVGGVTHATATGRVRRNMPDPIPVMVFARLAVDRAFQGRGVGRGLLRDAVLRTLQAAAIAGVRAILVHAISEDARAFYESCGFRPSPIDRMTLMITVADARKAFTGEPKAQS